MRNRIDDFLSKRTVFDLKPSDVPEGMEYRLVRFSYKTWISPTDYVLGCDYLSLKEALKVGFEYVPASRHLDVMTDNFEIPCNWWQKLLRKLKFSRRHYGIYGEGLVLMERPKVEVTEKPIRWVGIKFDNIAQLSRVAGPGFGDPMLDVTDFCRANKEALTASEKLAYETALAKAEREYETTNPSDA